ncbi:MAG: DegT/DnrJ/EryC1/StrS family aminotransferase [Abitibacteriaceae bacterium]|nr:DegT/DnrJ/EryC1/StrS family aminotransferase [Abditibacteriaceae bacterium]
MSETQTVAATPQANGLAAGPREQLAVEGGTPVRTQPWPGWPVVDEEDVQAVSDAVRSGVWGGGEQALAFAQRFADLHGVRHGIACNSGTTALQIALSSLGVGPGDEVIVPAYTFVATATSVLLIGATPVFADIEPNTYNLDPASVERAITSRTRAIVPVHFGGAIADMEGFRALGEKYSIPILEDAAHAHGAVCNGQSPGAWGVAACFSFQSSKNLTCGEGGLILTNDDAVARQCRSRVNIGRVEGGAWYEHHLPGGNYRLGTMQAALLLSQLRRFPEQAHRRDQNGRYLDARLGTIEGIQPLRSDARQTLHSRHLYIFRYDSDAFGLPRQRFLELLQAEGVPASTGYPVGLHQQPLYSGRGLRGQLPGHPMPHLLAHNYSADACPVTEHICASEAVWLTQNALLAEAHDMDDIVRAVSKIRATCNRDKQEQA